MVSGKILKVLIVRSNHCNPDPRVQKIREFLSFAGYSVGTLAWYRAGEKKLKLADSNSDSRLDSINIDAPYGNGVKNILAQLRYQIALMYKLISRYRDVDIIHACNLDTGLTAYIFCKLTNKKLVYDCFDFYADSFPVPKLLKPAASRLEKWLMSSSDMVIIASEARVKQISGANPKVLSILPNVPPVNIDKPSTPHNQQLTFAYVGSLTRQRFLLETLKIVEENIDIALRIAGFGELEEEIQRASERCERITFLGQVSYSEGLKIASDCDVLFAMYDPQVPNHRYSAPNKYYEAAMLGKPIVVAAGTGIDELVRRDGSGYVSEYSTAGFTMAINEILTSRGEAIRKGAIGRVAFERLYTLESTRQSFLEDYEKVS
jgi:glycosyltransferase involved in cell wall biosynthesis